MRLVLAGFLLCVASAVTQAQDAAALLTCPSKTDDRSRLACFDAAMKATTGSQPAATGRPVEDVVTNTKRIVAEPATPPTAKPESFRLIDADDLYVAPNKYIERPVELRRMKCLHADKDEYRCVASGTLTLAVFAARIKPEREREAIESDCGEVKKMSSSPKCVKTLRFIPLRATSDIVNGYQKRIVVVAAELDVVSGPAQRRP